MKLPYFKLGDALNDVKDGFNHGTKTEKLASVSKLLGKTVANAGMLAAEFGVEAAKYAPEALGNMAKNNVKKHGHLMTSEQLEKQQDLIRRGDEAYERRIAREDEEYRRKSRERGE